MKITSYVSELTRKEGLKESVNVAQVAELLKLLNNDLWGVPYFLIRLKRS